MDTLNDDTLKQILQFIGMKSYIVFGSINKRCHNFFLVDDDGGDSGNDKAATTNKNTIILKRCETFIGNVHISIIDRLYNWGDCKKIKQQNLRKGIANAIVLQQHHELLEWSVTKQDVYLLQEICELSAQHKYGINVLDYVFTRKNKSKQNERITIRSRWNNNNNINNGILSCLLKNTKLCDIAAQAGQLEILKFLFRLNHHNHQQQFDEWTCAAAAKGGSLNCLKWLRQEVKCPWNTYTLHYAKHHDHMHLFEWAQQNGCPE